jgi:hypothetical protein
MPTSPDREWNNLLDGLADNNVGGITEEDVRALAKFSKVSVAEFGNSLYTVSTGLWTGTLSSEEDANTAQAPVYTKLINSGTGSYLTSYNDLEVDTTNGLFKYSSTNAVAPRLFQMTWRIEAYMPSLQNLAVVFYYVSDGDTFPTSKRHIADRIWYMGGDNVDGTITRGAESSGEMTGGDNYSIAKTSGSGYIYLAPGSKVVPVLEYYGPDALIEFNASYHLGMHSLGSVEVDADVTSYFTTAYWDGVSNDVIDSTFPTATERRLGSLT